MLFPSIGSLHTDNWVKSTSSFLVFMASVLAYYAFMHMTSIHFSISLLVVFRVQCSTLFTSLLPVFIHLPHSAGIHLLYSAAIFSLATHRFDYSFFAMLLFYATTPTYLPFSAATSPINFLQFFRPSLITCTSISQCLSPRIPQAIILSSPPSFTYFILISFSTLKWDFLELLLLSGDVDSNPGPCPVDNKLVFCTICSLKIKRGVQQRMAQTDCYAQSHQVCNGLTANQTRHTKSCGRTIT